MLIPLLLALQITCPHDDVIRREARAAGIPPTIALAVMHVESACRPEAVGSPVITARGDTIHARGLMQVMPRWLRTNLRARCGADLHDPTTSACFGARILAYEYARFGNWPAALRAYSGNTPGYEAMVRRALRPPPIRLRLEKHTTWQPDLMVGCFLAGAIAGVALLTLILGITERHYTQRLWGVPRSSR